MDYQQRYSSVSQDRLTVDNDEDGFVSPIQSQLGDIPMKDQGNQMVEQDASTGGDLASIPRNSRPLRTYPFDPRWWLWEILGSIVAIMAFAGLIILLKTLDGKEEQTWGHVTLNAIVSIIATIISTALTAVVNSALSQGFWNWIAESRNGRKQVRKPWLLKDLALFDDASRGTLGGLMLIWRLRVWHLASLGASLTILILGLGPFLQLLVNTETRNIPATSGSALSFARSEVYSSVPIGIGETYAARQKTPDLYTKAAVYNGALGGNVTGHLPSCSTGNCTFSRTPTLAMCGACTDVSSLLNTSEPCSVNSAQCSYHLPNGVHLDFVEENVLSDGFAIFNASSLDSFAYGDSSSQPKSMVYNDSKAYTFKFATVGWPPNATLQNYGYGNTSVVAHECALWWCIQAYDTTFDLGVADKHPNENWSEAREDMIQVENANNTETILTFGNIPSDLSTLPGVKYGVDQFSWDSVTAALAVIVLGGSEAIARLIPQQETVAFGPNLGESGSVPNTDVLEGLWYGSADMSAWINNMATSLSNNIAVTSPADPQAYQGIALVTATFFEIRWLYIIFPLAVILLALCYFVAVVFETQRKVVRPWKVGVFALLFADVDERIRSRVQEEEALDRASGLNTIGKVEMRLRRRSQGDWAFEFPQ